MKITKPTLYGYGNGNIVGISDREESTSGDVKNNQAISFGALARLRELSATKRIDELKAKLENTVDLIAGIVNKGTITALVAEPNGGKTLITLALIIDGIRQRKIDAQRLFYINEDDGMAGFVTKAELAAEHGFHMISSTESAGEGCDGTGFIRDLIRETANTDEADDVVVVFDTLKKFIDVMNKADVKAFMSELRRFNHAGGTAILLSHANKNRDAEGRLIFEGVGDIRADIDVMFDIECYTERDSIEQKVEFINRKDRGSVEQRIPFTYRKSNVDTYAEMVASVQRAPVDKIEQARKKAEANRYIYAHREAWLFLLGLMEGGSVYQRDVKLATSVPKTDDGKAQHLECNPNSVSWREVYALIRQLSGHTLDVTHNKAMNNAALISLRDGVGDDGWTL